MRRQRACAICTLARRIRPVEERERVEVEHESCACERFDGEEPGKGDGGHCIVAFAEVKACVDAERHCGSGKFQVGGKETGQRARTEDEDERPGAVAYEEEEHGRVAPAVAERDDKLVQRENKQDRLEGDKSDAVSGELHIAQ